MDIEKLLQWAFREELPRGMAVSASAWSAMDRYCTLGCRIQEDFVGMHMRSALGVVHGEPHDDAKKVGMAVKALEPAGIDWEASKEALAPDMLPLASWSPWLERFATAVLVVSNAVMGSRPVWDIGTPTPKRVLGSNGKPAIEGECRGANLYTIGSFCPLVYSDPTPKEVIAARAEYAVWHAALVSLANNLRGNLAEYEAMPPACAAEPWVTGEYCPRILPIVGNNLAPAMAY